MRGQFFRGRWVLLFFAALLGLIAGTAFYRGREQLSPGIPDTRLDMETFLEAEAVKSGYELLPLVCNREIAQELDLTAAQTARFQALAAELLDNVEAMSLVMRGANKSSADKRGDSTFLQEKLSRLRQGLESQVQSQLLPTQLRRLGQITVQMRGPDVFSQPSIRRQLMTSPEQHRGFALVRASYVTKVRQLRDELTRKRISKKAFQEGAETLKQQALQENIDLLNASQRDLFESMRGVRVPFEISQLSLELRRGVPDPEIKNGRGP